MKKTRLVLYLLLISCVTAVASEPVTVRHVSDGDTVILSNGQKVRLIGIDTPELHDESRNQKNASRNHLNSQTVQRFAEKAKRFTRDRIEGKPVRLEYDWQRQDKYGRTLAYVYREPDGLFLNEEILREGYGFAYTVFPFKYSDRFRMIAEEARKEKRGLWK